MRYTVSFECLSHVGIIRKINQDNFICAAQMMPVNEQNDYMHLQGTCPTKEPVLFGVFDGMGGEDHGEIAAYIAAEKAAEFAFSKPKNTVEELTQFCHQVSNEIFQYSKDNHFLSMGTTAALLLFDRKGITLCNVGDSKIFRFSEGRLEQISQDHVATAAYGVKPPLIQYLGIPPTETIIDPYLAKGTYCYNDLYLICSDGLTDMVPAEQIAEILNSTSCCSAAQQLLQSALANGGKDNITILLCKISK